MIYNIQRIPKIGHNANLVFFNTTTINSSKFVHFFLSKKEKLKRKKISLFYKNCNMQIILNHQQIQQKITRLGHQILENCFEEETIFIGGISGNGTALAKKLTQIIQENSEIEVIFFEIDVNKEEPWSAPIKLSIDERKLKKGFIVIVDDVVNSGKTMQYALMKFLEQATKAIKTVALVDRQHRRYPIKTDFVGLGLSTTLKDRVEVDLNETDSKAYLI